MKGPSSSEPSDIMLLALTLRSFNVSFDGLGIPVRAVFVTNYLTEMVANDEGPASA
jgi:hypothetical protein